MRSSRATSAKNIGKIFYNAATRSTGASHVDARKSPYWRTRVKKIFQVSSKPGGYVFHWAPVLDGRVAAVRRAIGRQFGWAPAAVSHRPVRWRPAPPGSLRHSLSLFLTSLPWLHAFFPTQSQTLRPCAPQSPRLLRRCSWSMWRRHSSLQQEPPSSASPTSTAPPPRP